MEPLRSAQIDTSVYHFTMETKSAVSPSGETTIETRILISYNGFLLQCTSKPFLGIEGLVAAEKWLASLTKKRLIEKAQIVHNRFYETGKEVEPEEVFKPDELEKFSRQSKKITQK